MDEQSNRCNKLLIGSGFLIAFLAVLDITWMFYVRHQNALVNRIKGHVINKMFNPTFIMDNKT